MDSTWFNDDAFWAAIRPALFDERRWGAAPEELENLLELAKTRPGAWSPSAESEDFQPGRAALWLGGRRFVF